ncbi:MAG: putative quorum-sensing-regulated virulence factor [Planctomycetota bacterium]|jgi:uncharacterized protein (DUF3820 family)
MSEVEIPFGKHRGEAIKDIPIKYLDWLLGQDWFVEKFDDLAEEVKEFLENEAGWQDGSFMN